MILEESCSSIDQQKACIQLSLESAEGPLHYITIMLLCRVVLSRSHDYLISKGVLAQCC